MTEGAASRDSDVEGVAEYLRGVERLSFGLPPFQRMAWVSEAARQAWTPVLERIDRARLDVTAHAVQSGTCGAAALDVAPARLGELKDAAADRGLLVIPLAGKFGDGLPTLRPGRSRYLLTRRSPAEALAKEPPERRLRALWDQLAMPDCCRNFEVDIRRPFRLTDDTLAKALNTPGSHCGGRTVQLEPGALLNPVFGLLGFALFSHAACSFSCAGSCLLGEAWVASGRDLGLDAEMDRVIEMSSWPLEWSALHGIAETRVPVFKTTAETTATAKRYSVEIRGTGAPRERASGLRFPYLRPAVLRITDSARFRRGLANPAQDPETAGESERPAGGPSRGRIVEPKQLTSPILDETLELLREKVPFDGRSIDSIYLSGYFNALRLDDGSTGSCMSYCRFRTEAAAMNSRKELEERLPSDPLLLGHLFSGDADFLQMSLRACFVSALSAPLIASGTGVDVAHRFDPSVFGGARRAVVLGFGGYFDYIVRHTAIAEVHLGDLSYNLRRGRIDRRLADYRQHYPDKTITVSSGFDNDERLAAADLVSITGSALCNGTMEEVLEQSQRCRTVIVQGQSASIYPERLFERGVSLVSTTLKPSTLIETARTDKAAFRRALEGRLPAVYLRPVRPA